jgi:hypothetical protein
LLRRKIRVRAQVIKLSLFHSFNFITRKEKSTILYIISWWKKEDNRGRGQRVREVEKKEIFLIPVSSFLSHCLFSIQPVPSNNILI